MRISRRFHPLVYTSVAALTGAALGFILVRATSIETWTLAFRENPQPIIAPLPPPVDQVVLAAPDALTLDEPPAGALPWKSSLMPRPADPGNWTTQVQPAPAPPPEATAPDARPDQSTSPKAKQRRLRRHQTAALRKRLAEISPGAKARLAEKFATAKAPWPPDEISFVAIKDKKILELYARSDGGDWTFVHRYPVLAASGGKGPKLLQGDRQVPEGLYRIVYLNPQSAYHVSLRVNYPNAFDRRMAAKDGRKRLGGDIMIHGKKSSAGCLAMGDEAAEELFVLAAQTGYSGIKVIIAPTDFRSNALSSMASLKGQPEWVPELYTKIASAMTEYKAPPKPGPSLGLLSFFTQ